MLWTSSDLDLVVFDGLAAEEESFFLGVTISTVFLFTLSLFTFTASVFTLAFTFRLLSFLVLSE